VLSTGSAAAVIRVETNLFMKSKAKAKRKQSRSAPSRWEGGQTQEGVLHWGPRDLKLLLGSVEMGSWKTGLCGINSQRLGSMSSTLPINKVGVVALVGHTGPIAFWAPGAEGQ
jgi:hypothetical protein